MATSKRRVTHSSTLWARPNPTTFQDSSQGEKRKGAQNHLLRERVRFLSQNQKQLPNPKGSESLALRSKE